MHLTKFVNMRQCCGKTVLRKTIFCYKMISFLLRELKFLGNIYFGYTERVSSVKVEKGLLLQRNDKKVTLLLIYHTSGF